MIRGKENLIKWVSSIPDANQVQVRTGAGTDAFLFQSDDEEKSKAIIDRLSDTLDLLEPGKYYIEVSDGKSKRNWYREHFILEGDNILSPATPAMNGPTMGVPSEEVDRRIAEALERQKMQFELESLRLKVKKYEDEEEEEGPLEKAIGSVEPYIPALMSALFGGGRTQQLGIAGTAKPIEAVAALPELADEDYVRLEAIGKRLSVIEPEYLSLLEKLCDKLEATPSMLAMIKSFL